MASRLENFFNLVHDGFDMKFLSNFKAAGIDFEEELVVSADALRLDLLQLVAENVKRRKW